ncbi:MAG: hypothetical protein HZB86_10710 [Deltaproteobacteria bacterium]|nr:hypothetical protein [Deltaproteobacteria bacterium]
MMRRGYVLAAAALVFACGIASTFSGTGGAAREAAVAPGKESRPGNAGWKYDYFDNFYDVASPAPQEIWIVGNSGRILHSADDGKTWRIQVSGTREDLYSVSFADARRGWCSGSNGLVLHTEDGGATWSRQTSGTSHPIFRIQFLSDKVGFACGYFGLFLRTADGGRTWENKSIGEDVTLRGMSFPDAKTGFIVGEFGTVLKTTDGGSSFTRLKSTVESTLFAVHFHDGKSGYASGIDGSVLSTVDGGRTWRKEDSGTRDHLIGIRSNGRIAVAVGLRGAVRAKAAGGKWNAVDARTLSWLSGVHVGKDSKGLVVGSHGTILRLEDIIPAGRDK